MNQVQSPTWKELAAHETRPISEVDISEVFMFEFNGPFKSPQFPTSTYQCLSVEIIWPLRYYSTAAGDISLGIISWLII